MLTAQNTFYIIGSVALALFSLFLIGMISGIVYLNIAIKKASRKAKIAASELLLMSQASRAFLGGLNRRVGVGVLATILGLLKRKGSKYER